MKAQIQSLPREEDLRGTSRDLLKIYKYALEHPEEKLITSSKFGKILELEGRALGGVLAGSQKASHIPLLVRQGVAKTTKGGKYESREQVWSLNPALPKNLLKEIKKILQTMMLDTVSFHCPNCENKNKISWTIQKKDKTHLCPNCGSTYASYESAWPKKKKREKLID